MSSTKVKPIPLANPPFDEEMARAALEALKQDRFVLGETVAKFEEDFAQYCGVKYAVSTNSGTDALHLTLLAMGVSAKDHVITSPFSFIATANAILHAGATPIFADIEPQTCNIAPVEVEKAITPQTTTLLPVHLYGYPCDMHRIHEIAETHHLTILEDACQAHGATYAGTKTGALGDAGCFSFYSSKNMTVCGDGGMLVTNNAEIAERVAKLRNCGRTSQYRHDAIGYTARLNTVNAAIGRVQLQRLDEWNQTRRRHAALYTRLLADLDKVQLPPAGTTQVDPVYHLYVIRVAKQVRAHLKAWLEQHGVQCGIHYPLPIHLQPIYQDLFGFQPGAYPQSEAASHCCLSIPMHPTLTENQIHHISELIHTFFRRQ